MLQIHGQHASWPSDDLYLPICLPDATLPLEHTRGGLPTYDDLEGNYSSNGIYACVQGKLSMPPLSIVMPALSIVMPPLSNVMPPLSNVSHPLSTAMSDAHVDAW